MNDTLALVVTYNRKELLRECVQHLLAQSRTCDILVIDNDSHDGTKDMIDSLFSDERLHYMNMGANLGVAGGNTVGMIEAIKKGYDYIWTLDDDAIPETNALEMLFKADKALKGNWGCLGGYVKWTNGTTCKANRQKKSIFTFVSDEEIRKKNIIPVLMTSFVSMFLKVSVIKDVGLPKKEYVIWSDDYEFSSRIAKKYPVYMITKSVVTHKQKENKKPNFAIETPDRLDRYKYLYRNDVDCYRQFGLKGWCYIILKDCYATINVLLKSKNDKYKKTKIIWLSFTEGLKFRPKIEIPE